MKLRYSLVKQGREIKRAIAIGGTKSILGALVEHLRFYGVCRHLYFVIDCAFDCYIGYPEYALRKLCLAFLGLRVILGIRQYQRRLRYLLDERHDRAVRKYL